MSSQTRSLGRVGASTRASWRAHEQPNAFKGWAARYLRGDFGLDRPRSY